MPAQAYITASNAADLVFKLRLRNGLTEVQLSKIPEELQGELESPRFLRVTEVGSQKATLTMYSSRASAMAGELSEDEQGVQLAPMVTATTLGLIGAEFLPIERYWREVQDDGSNEGDIVESEARVTTRDAAATAAAAAAVAAQATTVTAAAAPLSVDELVQYIMAKVDISLEAAANMVADCGVNSIEDLEQLKGCDRESIKDFAEIANMSLMEKLKFTKFTKHAQQDYVRPRLAASGGRSAGSDWLTQAGADDAASDEGEPARSAPPKSISSRVVSGGAEVEKLMGGVAPSMIDGLAIACIKLLLPAMMHREVRQAELDRPLPQLGALLRGLEKKGTKLSVAAPGGKEEVLDGVQEACIQLELGMSDGVGQQQQQQQPSGGASAGAALVHSIVYGGGAAGTSEKSQDDRAIVEALSFLDKNAKVSSALETLAASGSETDGELAKALAQLGSEEALRGIIYMKKEAIRVPSGMLASSDHVRFIKAILRLRTRVVEVGAEKLRPLLPAAGTKAGTPAEMFEAVWSGNLMQFKLHKLFQPEGGSALLATQGGKKGESQTPVELIVRGIMVLLVAYDHAHGSFDHSVLLTFAALQSVLLDATQKGVPPETAVGLILEATMGEVQRLWKQAAIGIGARPMLDEVAKAQEHRMMTTLSVEIAHAAQKRPPAPAKDTSPSAEGGKGGKESIEMAKLQRSIAELKKEVAAGGKGGASGDRQSFRQKVDAWEAENPGQCWFMANQREKCKKGNECQHFSTHAGHTT